MILYSRWCALSLPLRHKISQAFNIPKTGPTEVSSNQIKSDGYMVQDIEHALTVEAMQDFLGSGFTSQTDMATLWNLVVDKVEGKEIEHLAESTSTVPAEKSIRVLSSEEAKQFKKEYKARVAKLPSKSVTRRVAIQKKDVKPTKKK